MKGQRLFVRPIESGDRTAITAFLEAEKRQHSVSACGLLGKLVGDLVAVLLIEITEDGLRIVELVVRSELRRKRMGRLMLDELDRFARKLDRDRLFVRDPGAAREFFRRTGFVDDGIEMVRRVR